MEAFSMLRYWRSSGGGRETTVTSTTTIASTASPAVEETKKSSATEDEGPFFDLQFSMPDEGEEDEETEEEDETEEEEVGEEEEDMTEFNFTLSSSKAPADPNLSPADDLFFKGHLVPLEPSSMDSKSTQFPVSLLKSATKFRVFFLGFKKPKAAVEPNDGPQKQSKFFTVKFKVEEVPLVSLFTRDNSSRSTAASGGAKPPKAELSDDGGVLSERDARRAKDVVQKYLKMIKPLYVRVSKRYGEKLRFSGQLSLGSGKGGSVSEREGDNGGGSGGDVGDIESEAAPSPGKNQNQNQNPTQNQKPGSFPASLRVVCKHLGKSRSASSTSSTGTQTVHTQQRRDDSLLQQQDGIQSAIAHCKRSFNSSKEASQFCRDAFEDAASLTRSSEKGKGISI